MSGNTELADVEPRITCTRDGRVLFSTPLTLLAGDRLDMRDGKAYVIRDGEIIFQADTSFETGPIDESFNDGFESMILQTADDLPPKPWAVFPRSQ